MIGKSKLSDLVSKAFEEMELDSPDEATLGVCMLAVEVRMHDPDQTAIFTFSTDKRVWVQRAILGEALDAVGIGMVSTEENDG